MERVRSIGRSTGIDVAFVRATVVPVLLPLWFAAHAALIVYNYAVVGGVVGVDARIYLAAAGQVMVGGNPWSVGAAGYTFAGPPPTLVFYLPIALLPEPLGFALVMGAGIAAAIWSIRHLRLPYWWLLFPPLFEGVLVGNPDPVVLALLLMPGRIAGVAAALKIYAAIPLALQRRGGALVVAAVVILLSAPLWPAFFEQLDEVRAALALQSAGYSAWGTWFVIPVVVALWALRRYRASWLVVPALWPDTQIHYSTMSLPVIWRFPIAAAIIGLASPLSAPIAVIVMAVQARWWPSSVREPHKP